ncbi:DNA internalization-related competence protein ComEC/Rec2 [Pseudomonas sp.]|uniref:DNA internalization-related competence protein ComEC/Rec2 n=1 Tax=Pseudomonas sp. TaxID=306 RepID=UPI0019DB4B32|nr:DNA internalization-related competence protein ComEC/Rec2 [Pseudomonas sp.]MBF0673711.1 DNA internalization-related competence protein ComEC/Rec2 [Pseudomonas sp.]
MRTGMLALALGLLTLRFLPALPDASWLLAGFVLGLLLLPFRSYPLGLFCLGLVWACWSAQWALDDRLAPAFDGRTLWLEGQVVGLPEHRDGVVRFELRDAVSRRGALPSRLRLAWHGGPPVQAGERWRLAVNLKRPHGLVNPHGFDYEAWLLAKRIGATGSVKAGERQAVTQGLSAWRDSLRQRLLAMPAFGREGGLVALVLGDGSGLTHTDWGLLRDTGTVHLMVISGQHIGLLAMLVYGLVAGLARWGLWPRALPWLPWACGLALAAALLYGLLAGFEVPVRRACVMLAVVLLWRLRFRHLGFWSPLLAALVIVLLAEPLASLQAGFWLSFAAVAVLILVFSGRLGAWSAWRTLGRAQWTVAIGLLPVLLALSLPVSASGPLANLIAVPWVSLAVVPLALLATLLLPVPFVAEGLWWLAGGLLELLFVILAVIAEWLPAWLGRYVPVWAWLLGVLGATLLLLPGAVPLRWLGIPMLLVLIAPPRDEVPAGRAHVWLLDVGQGLSVLVRTREHALLYDTGARFGDFDLGERVVVPSLRTLGIQRLDTLLLSHADNDHAGGARAVIDGLTVGKVLSGEPHNLPAALQAGPCQSGNTWDWDGVRFRLWRWPQAHSGNAASCVLMVEASGERLLLTGDIDARVEAAMLASDWAPRAEWLLAPHHGSRFSSSVRFIQGVAPTAVLFARGAHNAFGHPHPSVVERYRQHDVQIHDTALEGALRIELGAFAPPRALRQEARFWREK